MINSIFVNLPIKNLKRSVEFFTKLGFTFNPQFTDEHTTCMIIGENMYAMLLETDVFEGFMDKTIPDTSKHSEVLVAMGLDNRADVERLANLAFENGARRYQEMRDLGFMLSWGFEDLDGHIWELFWMDPSNIE